MKGIHISKRPLQRSVMKHRIIEQEVEETSVVIEETVTEDVQEEVPVEDKSTKKGKKSKEDNKED
jgi:hypothetical protein